MKNRFYYFLLFLTLISCKKEIKVFDWSLDFNKKNRSVYYKGELFTGGINTYHENNQLASQIFYEDGKFHGSSNKWYPSGIQENQREYKHGLKQKKHIAWWPNGNKKHEFNYNIEGLFSGELKEWYANGKRYKEFNYHKGKQYGTQKLWDHKGRLKANYVITLEDKFGLIGSKKCINVND